MVIRVSDKTQNYSKVTKLLVKPKFIVVAKMHQKMGVDSYAMVQNISTINKLRVLKPINKYDPILKIRVSDEIMTILDNKLILLFTK